MQKKSKKTSSFLWTITKTVLAILLFVVIFGGIIILAPYRFRNLPEFQSSVGPLLNIFTYNQSTHSDPVKGCWYDSGDYLVFNHRNSETLLYLSYAYKYAQSDTVKADLLEVMTPQIECIEEMFVNNWKQFRDEDNHGPVLPPKLNEWLYPQDNYKYLEREGRDVALANAVVANNLGNSSQNQIWIERAKTLEHKSRSENCCEEGPLVFSDEELLSLTILNNKTEEGKIKEKWGISLGILATFARGDNEAISEVLDVAQEGWDEKAIHFDYIGGNYDIAGTIATIHIYTNNTGDKSYLEFADQLYSYLHGKNAYNVDFTNSETVYHPCQKWWAKCDLGKVLINGIDETQEFDLERKDIWRLTEVQLTGQAQFVLAEVLHKVI